MTDGWAQAQFSGGRSGRGGSFRPLREDTEVTSHIGDIMSIDPPLLANALWLTFNAGCGLLMSPTSDGGALSVTLYQGEDRLRSYATSKVEFEAILKRLEDLGEASMMSGTKKAPKAPVRGSQKATG